MKERHDDRMVFHSLEEIANKTRISASPKKVAVISAADEHILDAVSKAKKEGFVEPVLVGDETKIKAMLAGTGESPEAYIIVNEPDADEAARISVQMIKDREADFLMKGKINTSNMLRAVLNKESGLPCDGLVSYMCLMEIPRYHKILTITDGAIVVQPTLEQKKIMINNAVKTLRAMGYDRPKVAVLAAAENVSPKMPETVDGAALKEMNLAGEIPDCIVEGPISTDLALNNKTVKTKDYKSEVAGDADLLVVPNIVVGNALAKSLRLFAGAESIGMVLGTSVPIVLTSRGATAESKYLSLLVAAAVL